ncbi:hypothetical protein OG897_26755 [Streptomyces sp. NBC_00237]|uniref:hypothetical protein n=1 Tax=Streptomyces sp. NBC_00237 TaxID=2975687 RepID=UPI00225B03E6|nr:hypothetical protein [Streptomyces sp. NBC_00237]MCX5205045.1 hypothetical protein [Streptomyces sp. NBC_00237]
MKRVKTLMTGLVIACFLPLLAFAGGTETDTSTHLESAQNKPVPATITSSDFGWQ